MTWAGHLTSLSLREAWDGVWMLPAFQPDQCPLLRVASCPPQGVAMGTWASGRQAQRGHARPSRAQHFPVQGPPLLPGCWLPPIFLVAG